MKNSSINQSTIIKKEAIDAPPVNFSFKGVEDLDELRFAVPRQGRRKEIPKIETDENVVDEKPLLVEEEKQEMIRQGSADPEEETPDIQKQEVVKKEKDSKKTPSAIFPQTNQAQRIIQENNIPLGSSLTLQGKGTMKQVPKKVAVDVVCVSLIISYNKIRSIQNFYPIMDSILYDINRIQWIDLSHNYLESLDYDFKELPLLKTLYLHENFLAQIEDLKKLSHLPLKSLSIHGNPIDQVPNFRVYIIATLPHLKRLDSVLISKKERDNSNYLLNSFKLQAKPLVNPAKPPPKIVRKKQEQPSL